jgi:orotate phosphoribosyltransferase
VQPAVPGALLPGAFVAFQCRYLLMSEAEFIIIEPMDIYQQNFARTLAETGAIFFDDGLSLKDGRPTPYFVNMAMFKTGRLSLEIGTYFASMMVSADLCSRVDVILGPSYKGSALASATAIALWENHRIELPFDYDRKEAKTHGEASSRKSMFVNGTFFDGCRIFVVDDVATSMATKYELLEKIDDEAHARDISITVAGIGIGIDREQTTAVYDAQGRVIPGIKGKDAIGEFEAGTGVHVYRVARIRDVLDYLSETGVPVRIRGRYGPIDEETMSRFRDYLETYGVD